MLKKHEHDPHHTQPWDKYLKKALKMYNTTYHQTVKEAPQEVIDKGHLNRSSKRLHRRAHDQKVALHAAGKYFEIGDIVQLKQNLTNSTRSAEILKKKAGVYAIQQGKYVIVARRGQRYLIWPTNTTGDALTMLPFDAVKKPHKKLWWQPYYNLTKDHVKQTTDDPITGADLTMRVSDKEIHRLVVQEKERNKKISLAYKDKSHEIRELKDKQNPQRGKDAATVIASTRQLRERQKTSGKHNSTVSTRHKRARAVTDESDESVTAKKRNATESSVRDGEEVVERVMGHRGDDAQRVYFVKFKGDDTVYERSRDHFVDEDLQEITDKIVAYDTHHKFDLNAVYHVRVILGKRNIGKQTQYKVRWEGFPLPRQYEWVNAENLPLRLRQQFDAKKSHGS